MKKMKRLAALLISVLMVVSAQVSVMGITIDGEAELTVSQVASKIYQNSSKSARKAFTLLENDKYIFAVLSSEGATHSSVVQIYSKTDGTLIKSIGINSEDEAYYASIRSANIKNDVLYVTWGNVPKSSSGAARTTGSPDYLQSPTIAYDVSNVTAEDELKTIVIDKGHTYVTTYRPFTWGGISYLDDENGILYTSKFTGDALARRYYHAYNTKDVEDALKNNLTEVSRIERMYTNGLAINATQFMVKDRWLFEVLKVNGGWSGYSKSAYYEADTTKMTGNNMVNVYDLTDVEVTTSNKSIAGKLCATYTTPTEGNNAINDIEVVGDYLYVSTVNGIEVVSLAPAKEVDLTAEEVVIPELTASKTINTLEEAGTAGVIDLDVCGNYLFAAYAGSTAFETTAEEPSDNGAVVVYDVVNPMELQVVAQQTVSYGAAQISVNEDEKVLYTLHDNFAAAETYKYVSLSAYNYTLPVAATPEITSVKLGDSDKVTAGTYDITVDISNASGVNGKLICAIYKGNQLDEVFISNNTVPNGTVTIVEDYVVDSDITRIKAMFFADMEISLQPLCGAVEITK